MAEHKLDIFQTLAAIDQKQLTWLEKQPQENQRGFVPLVVMRWLSAVSGSGELAEWHIEATNEYLNKNFWLLTDYPDLLYKLSCLVGVGKKQRHEWIPMAGQKKAKNKALIFLGEMNPRSSWDELEMLASFHTVDSFKEYLNVCGVQKADEKDLIAAFKKYEQLEMGIQP